MTKASIAGGSGYAGGELTRLLHAHPKVEVQQITSKRYVGERVSLIHPNFRQNIDLRFVSLDDLEPCDVLFICLPNGESMKHMDKFRDLAPKIIDTGADFRLNSVEEFERWYGEHTNPEPLEKFVYGLVELHRQEIERASYVACGGCEATASILGIYPLFKEDLVDNSKTHIIDAKMGSSAAGSKANLSTHHPERAGAVRSFKPTSHRHTAEIEQELGLSGQIRISATSVEMVRGILITAHIFLKDGVEEKDVWKAYRKHYKKESFIRLVNEKRGVYRFPEPKIVMGTNYCDIGFAKEEDSNRLVVVSAVDNLVKGTAGQALQAMNVMFGFEETLGLEFIGLHPV